MSPFRVADDGGGDSENDDEDDYSSVLIGVFDGHAPRGEIVAEYTRNELPNLLSKKLSALLEEEDDNGGGRFDGTVEEATELKTRRILNETFVELDRNAPAEESGGCTCTVVLKRKNKIYVANAGDSRSFLVAYRPSTKHSKVLYISREDKPELPDERARVEATGGQVVSSRPL